ncbi:MAG: CPBP family intramembrane metalloprotease [Saprospiraceae bacterium]|nr:CPBP family intramembrane metalloprotease [Saprospiraceae bacterium]MBK8078914.1 CPBP family intramembrane metalloprotease [Saprospiraceae bacterium]
MTIHWYDHLLFALIGIIIPFMSFRSRIVLDDMEAEPDLPPKKHLYLNNFFILGIGMLLCLTAWNAGKNDWELLGFTNMETDNQVWLMIIILLVIYLADGLYTFFKKDKPDSDFSQMLEIVPLTWKEYFYFIPLAIMAGVSEEIIFRGYLFQYISTYLPNHVFSPYFAIVLISLGFSLSHLYQGWIAAVKIFFISILFGIIYFYSKSLVAVIIIHIVIDLMSGMSGIFFIKKIKKEESQILLDDPD